MATTVLDPGGPLASPRAAAPADGTNRVPPAARRRVPGTVLLAGWLSIVEGVGLLAVALTGLDGVLAPPSPVPAPLLATGVLVLAGWIVLAAGSGVALVDGSGRGTYVGLALAEIGLVALAVPGAATPVLAGLVLPLPLPAAALLALAVPVGKLLLGRTPTVRGWVAQGPRVRETRPDPVAAHRRLAALTLGVIGAALVALTVVMPAGEGAADRPGTVAGVVDQP